MSADRAAGHSADHSADHCAHPRADGPSPDSGVLRVSWLPGTDVLCGTCHCGARYECQDPVRMWDWLLAHPDHPDVPGRPADPGGPAAPGHPGRPGHPAPKDLTR